MPKSCRNVTLKHALDVDTNYFFDDANSWTNVNRDFADVQNRQDDLRAIFKEIELFEKQNMGYEQVDKQESAINIQVRTPTYSTMDEENISFNTSLVATDDPSEMKNSQNQQQIQHKQNNECIYCDECGQKFRFKKELRKHIRDNNIFFCEFCNETFSREYMLSEHVKSVHENENFDINDVANNEASAKSDMDIRKNTLSEKQKSSTCEICNDTYSSNLISHIHIEIVHIKLKTFNCDLCSKIFGAKRKIRNHIQIEQMKLGPFKRDLREKNFQ